MRIYAMMNPTNENFDYFFKTGPWHKKRLTVSAVKLYADGALGSRGALLLKPYYDMPGHIGLQLHPAKYYDSVCNLAYNARFQVCTHAIGDSANRLILQTYSKYLRGKNDLRWRVEHAQVIAPSDFHYFAGVQAVKIPYIIYAGIFFISQNLAHSIAISEAGTILSIGIVKLNLVYRFTLKKPIKFLNPNYWKFLQSKD